MCKALFIVGFTPNNLFVSILQISTGEWTTLKSPIHRLSCNSSKTQGNGGNLLTLLVVWNTSEIIASYNISQSAYLPSMRIPPIADLSLYSVHVFIYL